jgi:hypothetical protein
MTWPQLTPDDALLILSILAGLGAAAVLLREILRLRLHNLSGTDLTLPGQPINELENKKQRPSLLDRITLLNKNLIQCPRCFSFDFAHARFCTRCGTLMESRGEMSTSMVHDVEVRCLAQDESNRMYGFSMRIDPKTRIGVIIGIQNREAPEQINETHE